MIGKIGYKALLCALLLGALPVHAQTLFNRFGPASGILVGNPNSPLTTAAAWSNVQALISGTCDSSHVVTGAGTCVVGGSVTSVGLTMPSGFTVTGSPVTGSGALAVSTTLSGLLKGNGSGFTVAAVSDVLGLFSGTCNSSTFLNGAGACASPAITVPGSNTDVLFNNSGVLGASNNFTFNGSNVNVGNNIGFATLTTGGPIGAIMFTDASNNAVFEQAASGGGDLTVENLSTTGNLKLGSGGAIRAGVNSSGNWTFNAPTSGTAIVVNQPSASSAPMLLLQSPASTASGMEIAENSGGGWQIYDPAGSSDLRFYDGTTDRFILHTGGGEFMDGGLVVGSATGGSQGAGTINAQGLYINGSPVTASSNPLMLVAYDGSFTSRTNTTTETCSTALTFTGLNSSKVYAVHVQGQFAGNGGTTNGYRFVITGLINYGYVEATTNVATIANATPTANHFGVGITEFLNPFPAANANVQFVVDGIVAGSTSTCFAWAQDTSSATATQLLYTYMTVTQLN